MSEMLQAAPVFPVRDMRKAIAYYQEALGFRPAYINQDGDGPPVYACMARDGVQIQIYPRPDMTYGAGCTLFVRGVDAIYQEYRDKGVNITRDVENSPYGLREFCCKDLDGNQILIGEHIGK
jgi:uncharacterized glyoxalase superfamily protein PhnB